MSEPIPLNNIKRSRTVIHHRKVRNTMHKPGFVCMHKPGFVCCANPVLSAFFFEGQQTQRGGNVGG